MTRLSLRALPTLLAAFLFVPAAVAQNASVQLVHNAPDRLIEFVDVYANGTLLADDFQFRNATTFLSVPPGATEVAVAPSTSASADEAFFSTGYTLDAGDSYFIVLSGLTQPQAYLPNPDELPTDFRTLLLNARTGGSGVQFRFANGTPDARSVTFEIRGEGNVAEDLGYESFSSYRSLGTRGTQFTVHPATAPSLYYGVFPVPLNQFNGTPALIMTSGFIDPFLNQNGPPFRLLTVASNGFVDSVSPVAVPDASALMQFINNIGDPTLGENVDVFVDGGLAIDNMFFRTATGFLSVAGPPIQQNTTISVHEPVTGQELASTTLTLIQGRRYVVLLNGVSNPSAFAPNPEGRDTGIDIVVWDGIRLESSAPEDGQVAFFNAVTDAPSMDVYWDSRRVTDTSYGDPSSPSYSRIPPSFEGAIIEAFPASTTFPVLIRHALDWFFVQGRAYVMVANGFIDPESNQNGRQAEIFLVTPDGLVIDLSDRERVDLAPPTFQAIHLTPDPSIGSFKVELNGTIVGDPISFREATPYIQIPTRDVVIRLLDATSDDEIRALSFRAAPSTTRIGTLIGLAEPSEFLTNPSGRSTQLDFPILLAEYPSTPALAAPFPINAMPDGPDYLVVAPDSQVVADRLPYGRFGDNVTFESRFGPFRIFDAVSDTLIATTTATFGDAVGRPSILALTGFLKPSENQNGPGYLPLYVLRDGSVFSFPDPQIVSNEAPISSVPSSLSVYPNPSSDFSTLQFHLNEPGTVQYTVVDAFGRILLESEKLYQASGAGSVRIDTGSLASGTYFIRLERDDLVDVLPLTVLR